MDTRRVDSEAHADLQARRADSEARHAILEAYHAASEARCAGSEARYTVLKARHTVLEARRGGSETRYTVLEARRAIVDDRHAARLLGSRRAGVRARHAKAARRAVAVNRGANLQARCVQGVAAVRTRARGAFRA